jgi:hypothetical protein
MTFYGNKMDVVRFATDLQLRFGKDSELTTITRAGTSGGYYVSTVIDTSSDAIVKKMAQACSLRRINT